MSKKFFDIIPPHLITKTEKKIKHFIDPRGKKKIRKERKGAVSIRLKGVLISAGILCFLIIVYLYFSLASATVKIWPKTESVTFEEKVMADELLNEIDLEALKIPSQLVEEEKELWQEFPATGSSSKEGVAQGTIRVYNKYNPPTPINLKSKTRFLSNSGKYFRSVDKINIPAAQLKSGKITPSWVDVKVTAIESGEAYNIDPADFSVPGLAGTPYYYAVYGKSSEKMTGGYETTQKIVTLEDIDNAKNNLTQKLLDDTEQSLRDRISSSNSILFESALTKNVVESSSSVNAGAEINSFSYKVKVKVSALVFKKSDLTELAKNYIDSQIEESQKILEKTLSLDYLPETIDLKSGKLSFNLRMSSEVYRDINIQEMTLSFMGKPSNQIGDIVYSELGQDLSRLKVDFWPFWVTKAPKNQKKIKVELKFEPH